MIEKKPTPVERHKFEVADVTKKNPDGTRRQDVISQCAVGEPIILTKGEKDIPAQERVIGVCRKKDGNQIGTLKGAMAARLARPNPDEFVDAIISGIGEVPSLFSRKPKLNVSIEVLLFEYGSVPGRALQDRKFDKMVFHYRPDKEQNAQLLQQVASELSAVMMEAPDEEPLHRNLQQHDALNKLLRHYYANKETDPSGLTKAIIACQMQIAIAPEVKKNMLNGSGKTALPPHSGFELLCIVREKQRMYEEAISLAEEAEKLGWQHNWKVRIERCKRKLEKRDKRWQENT